MQSVLRNTAGHLREAAARLLGARTSLLVRQRAGRRRVFGAPVACPDASVASTYAAAPVIPAPTHDASGRQRSGASR